MRRCADHIFFVHFVGRSSTSSSPTSRRSPVRPSPSVYPSPGPQTARRSSAASPTTSSGCGTSSHKPRLSLLRLLIHLVPYFAHREKCTAHCWVVGRRQLAGRSIDRLYVRSAGCVVSYALLHVASKSKLCFAHSCFLWVRVSCVVSRCVYVARLQVHQCIPIRLSMDAKLRSQATALPNPHS